MLQEGSVSAVFQHRQGAKKADFNQAMTRVDPIMGGALQCLIQLRLHAIALKQQKINKNKGSYA